jgi:hypothetical protein
MEYMKTKERKGGLIEHGLGDWGRGIAIAAGYPEADTVRSPR